MKTILFQGDSITDSERSRTEPINMGYGYATLVTGEIGYEYPGEYITINRGISGNRIVDLYARIKADIINLKPDILSILIGVNDILHEAGVQNGVSADKYYRIYSMLIEEIIEALPSVKIMILEPFVLLGSATKTHWEEISKGVKERAVKAKEVAEKYGLPFITLQDKFDKAVQTTSNEYWLVDGVHPSVAGHELIKREWIKGFEQLKDRER